MSDDITCSVSVSTNRKLVTGRIRAILFVQMASIIDSSMEVFIECVRGFPCVWQIQSKNYKNIRMKENA